MERIIRLLPLWTLIFILCSFSKIQVSAGEGIGVQSGAGTPMNPYVLESPSFGYGGDYTNNGFNMPASTSASHIYYQITIPSDIKEGAIRLEDPTHCKLQGNWIYKSAGYVYQCQAGETIILGFEPGKTEERFINIACHLHSRSMTQYKLDGDQCVEIEKCLCGDTVPAAYKTTKVAHSYGAVTTVKASCLQGGYKSKKCSHCGYIYKYDFVSKLEHIYTDGRISKHDKTYHKQYCRKCDKEYQLHVHSYVVQEGIKTCQVCGYSCKASSANALGTEVYVKAGSLLVTKLSANKVSITVTMPQGASKTAVYCGTQKIKTLTQGKTFYYSKTGYGNKKFRVKSRFDVNGKVFYSKYSKEVAGKSNVWTDKNAGSYNAKNMGNYATTTHRTAKLFFSGNTLKCTAYIYNNRIFSLKKIRIRYTLIVNGKKYAKTVTKALSIAPYSKKKITYTLGKGLCDLRYAIDSKSVSTDGDWKWGWNK